MTRGLILALQFLTRLPVPTVPDYRPEDLSRCAVWFPAVGLLLGAGVWAALYAGASLDPWLGALLALLVWTGLTGALHLDGLADLCDALGAAHRDRTRFLEVLRDPHVGTFGATALIAAIVSKLVLLGVLVRRAPQAASALPLLAAWSRLGAIAWSRWLPALSEGTAQRFAWHTSWRMIACWTAVLLAGSALIAPALLAAPVAILVWRYWLKHRLGGQTGDCLGAGIELVEIALLLATLAGAATGAAPLSMAP